MATFKQRIDQHDREIAAIRKLVLTGMKMLVKSEEEIRELAAQQRATARELEAFIRSLRQGSNGHTKR
jgi:hypothetical protein